MDMLLVLVLVLVLLVLLLLKLLAHGHRNDRVVEFAQLRGAQRQTTVHRCTRIRGSWCEILRGPQANHMSMCSWLSDPSRQLMGSGQ